MSTHRYLLNFQTFQIQLHTHGKLSHFKKWQSTKIVQFNPAFSVILFAKLFLTKLHYTYSPIHPSIRCSLIQYVTRLVLFFNTHVVYVSSTVQMRASSLLQIRSPFFFFLACSLSNIVMSVSIFRVKIYRSADLIQTHFSHSFNHCSRFLFLNYQLANYSRSISRPVSNKTLLCLPYVSFFSHPNPTHRFAFPATNSALQT